ncbi:Putative amidase AmiD [Paenibacillus solanacearum]|uniref:Amidase AmiD n=1 Tax=Paenibacillus solanacearum TaxID=2048548 RepID=A0A916K0D9_9BACL|nr:amidase [Paenibacillus solanacearum]CAG7621814.1 Putative amidase AmiD [Paenibacillus solanacearum]
MLPMEEAGIAALREAMTAGELTSAELVRACMKRIAAHDRQGPKLNAVLELNPDALAIAEALDNERQRQGARGPLHGIPVLLKDNIDTGDHMHTSAGSIALAEHYAAQDAFVAARLREAGAVLLGKANMTEWANFMTQGMPGGYSSRGGQVLNPYGADFSTGGSSAGSGVAVAAGYVPVTVGTETSGSILSPAVHNAVVGIKPTVGLISRSGIIPLAHSQDTAGPLARTVADAACLLGAMTGWDAADPVTGTSRGRVPADYTAYLDRDGLRGARIGIPRNVYHDGLSDEEKQLFEQTIARLKEAGAIVIDPADIPSAEALKRHRSSVLLHEFKADVNAYLHKLAPHLPVHSLEQLIVYNAQHFEQALRYGQVTLMASEQTSGALTEPGYLEDRLTDLRLSRTEGIDAVLAAHRLDALLFPSTTGADIAAKAGYPSIAVPGGCAANGKPFGLCFTGTAYSEPALIRIAYAFEQSFPLRKKPALDR